MTLEQARKLLNLSQSQLERLSGVKKSAISDIEIGRVDLEAVSHGTVTRLVRALKRAGLPGLEAEEVFPVRDRVGA